LESRQSNQRNRHRHRCRDASVDSAGLSAKNNCGADISAVGRHGGAVGAGV